jgi:hypothetical protein
MASHKQLLANRANAVKSTGPVTEVGKAKSRLNALRHGLTARDVVIPGENQADYQALLQRAIEEIQPDDLFSESLADRFVSTLWRLRRIPKLEQAYLAWSQHKRYWEDCPAPLDVLDGEPFGFRGKPSLLPDDEASQHQKATDAFTSSLWPAVKDTEFHVMKIVGRAVEDACNDANVLTKLAGYEARLLRQLDSLVAQLERWGEGRAARATPKTEKKSQDEA